MDIKNLFGKKGGNTAPVGVVASGVYEVNLVPDVKAKLLHAQRLRNVVIFFSLVVAAGGVVVVLLLASVVGGQNIALGAKDKDMAKKSGTILNFQNVNQILTIQDQLNKIGEINDNKKLLSRVFGVLDVILPAYAMGDEDEISMQELNVDLAAGTLSFDGQGDSKSNIDYRALEAFKKGVGLSYYDYGRYINKDGEEIPTMCITEETRDYVVWGIYHTGMEGCGLDEEDEDAEEEEDVEGAENAEESKGEDIEIKRDMTEDELNKAKENGDYYFQSVCVTYWGKDGKPQMVGGSGADATCMLASEPVAVRDSMNGRDSSDKLVLRFSAVVSINAAVFDFANKHMRVIGPARQNVTDSYVQVRDMFDGSEACKADDEECLGAVNNEGGEDG